MRASIVIGLGFGDEGKGVTVSSLVAHTHPKTTIVIRFSGGAQAAHTVMYDDKKHVHSSYGSGTLQGIPTYLTEHYLLDPQAMLSEKMVLEAKGITSQSVFVHPLARVVTPFDIADGRNDVATMHDGTCGMGIGSTMTRNLSPYKLYAKDLMYPDICRHKLHAIADYYAEGNRAVLIEPFMKELELINLTIIGYGFLTNFKDLIFEGSQGIMLDMEHGLFPNVTYAHTTSKNALDVCKILDIDEITKYYVTRAYQTRHGNGWMSNERLMWLKNTQHETNVTGEFQGDFRIGKLDYELLNYALDTDMAYRIATTKENHKLVVTCLDQVEDSFKPELLGFTEYYACTSPEGFIIND